MKRIGLLAMLLVSAAVAVVIVFAQDPLYWKRRALQALYAPADLPGAYYEPSAIIEGGHAPEPPRVQPEQELLDPAALQLAADYAAEHDSIALVIARHGHIAFERYWNGASIDTLVDGGSMTATVTALMLGIALDDRRIGLVEEPLANYIESFGQDNRRIITIAHLLQMSSGLGASRGGTDPWTPSVEPRLVRDIRSECLGLEQDAPPGRRWLAQVCDPQLLAHVIERASGEAFPAYISKMLWMRIGAADAYLMLDHEGGTAHAGCCMRARIGDWMRLAEVLVTGGRYQGDQVVSPAWVQAMRTPAPGEKRFGYQVWLAGPFEAQLRLASEPYAADDTLILAGHGKTRLWVVPSMGLTVLRVGTGDDIDAGWDDSRIPNLVVRGAKDYVPKGRRSGVPDVSTLVPGH